MTKNCFDCNGDTDFGCEDCLNKSKGDLISREALKNIIEHNQLINPKLSVYDVLKIIDNAPTVEINKPDIWWNGYDTGKVIGEHERPQGEWIKNAEEWQRIDPPYFCSECGHANLRKTPFCEMCGADMRGEEE